MPDPEPASHAAPKQAAAPSEPPPAREENCAVPPGMPLSQGADYYEVLQISPNADPETVHRVYRIMASRFHPDNPVTGSLDRFLQLREAYQTLSEPALRAAYDASHQSRQTEPMPVFWQKSFVDGIEGETNRRLGVLSLLYHRRRVNEDQPGVSVMELEQRMAFPREYLNFALWYLRSKGYVALMPDNSDYAVTSAGVDFVESCSVKNTVIRELLTAGNGAEEPQSPEHPDNVRRMSPRLSREVQPDDGIEVRAESNCGD
jgi:curved DNA-binding protein CbpA